VAAPERRRGDHAGSRHFAIAHSNRQIRIERWRNKSDVALRTVVDFGLIVGSAFVLYRYNNEACSNWNVMRTEARITQYCIGIYSGKKTVSMQ